MAMKALQLRLASVFCAARLVHIAAFDFFADGRFLGGFRIGRLRADRSRQAYEREQESFHGSPPLRNCGNDVHCAV